MTFSHPDIEDQSGITAACSMILRLALLSSSETLDILEENFPTYYYDILGSNTFHKTNIPRSSMAFRKGQAMLLARAFTGVELPKETEPEGGISLEALEAFFDKVAEAKGMEILKPQSRHPSWAWMS